MKKNKAIRTDEAARAAYLAGLFEKAEALYQSGECRTIEEAIDRISKNQNRAVLGGRTLCPRTLRTLFWRWQKAGRSVAALMRNYKPGKARIPAEFAIEFLNRLSGGNVISAAAAMESLRADWKRGEAVPGLGTWQEWARRYWGERGWKRTTAPRFPVSMRSMYRLLDRGRAGEFSRRIGAALRGQRDLARFANHLECCRDRLTSRMRHEPMGSRLVCVESVVPKHRK